MGTCHICGKNDQMTREHVPPKAARNVGHLCVHNLYSLSKGLSNGRIFQNGMTRRTLCCECNGKTSEHYVRAFASWTLRALEYYKRVPDNSRVALPFTLSNLRVAKQVAVMTLAMSEPSALDLPHFFRLRRLVTLIHLYGRVPKFRFFIYFHVGSPVFEGPFASIHTSGGSSPFVFCQVGLEPLGYIVTGDDDSSITWAKQLGLCDISHFFEFPLDELHSNYLVIPRMRGEIPFRPIVRM